MLNLNQSAISSANNASQFDAGSALAREAERVYVEGLGKMQAAYKDSELNEVQSGILGRRQEEWRGLVEKAYNDIISRRASWVPWTVSGPANYPTKRMNARAEAQMNAANEWAGKMDRFIENTVSMLRDAIPHEQLIAEYRSGKRREAIPGDDPLALEKLSARLEGMKERHELMKQRNAWWRKHKTMKGCPGFTDEQAAKMNEEIMKEIPIWQCPYPHFSLSNSNAEIKRIEERIKTISSQRETGDAEQVYNGFTVEQSGADGRINITFDGKPEEAARQILKANAFHWSPRAKVWTRQLTENARRAFRLYVLPGLLALPEYAQQDLQEAPQQAQEEPLAMTLAEFISAASAAE